jgi:uncharacterized protein
VTLYVDASALLKRYLAEPDTDAAEALLLSDPELATGRHTAVEVRRSLAKQLSARELAEAQQQFRRDLQVMVVIELTEAVCEAAAGFAESTGVRSLDALHLGAAHEVGAGRLPFLTYDVRQAQAARGLGWTVLGV